MKEADITKTISGRIMNEPTMHFFMIAMVVFIVYAISNIGSKDIVEIDQREIDARILMQEMASGQPLTPEQKELIASSYVEEQILVIEATELGLDTMHESTTCSLKK